MKKLLAILSVILFISCDDGDMTFKNFDFGNATLQYCSLNDLLYKYNGTEMLILDIPSSYFTNVEGDETVVIGNNNKVIYRNYNNTANSSVICSDIPPSSPIVIEEWNASAGGTLRIQTEKLENNSYQHVITIIYLEFVNGGQSTVIENQSFGTYTTQQSYQFEFIVDSNDNEIDVLHCDGDAGLIFKYNAYYEALKLDLTPEAKNTLFVDEVTPGDEYRVYEFDENNRIIFDIYSGSLSSDVICSNVPPVNPVTLERWNGDGGEIRVRTTISEIDGSYEHHIALVGITFINSGNTEETFEIQDYYPEDETEYPFGIYP
ncbi:hypothetical protein FUA48_14430 [Flavobacterium alkalisoli]|uniref:Uncharacterized protein n=1 Tax=Flavobacterium alkalisoli TaxID=2602769 RepID=A0A5B9FUU5_9FLAO|nr:hypothetical protein [Flavobacterium alkalisoli]QEE50730.1 hypothetical protein FUA48_14430 [Flavobacterium alkalisoli]